MVSLLKAISWFHFKGKHSMSLSWNFLKYRALILRKEIKKYRRPQNTTGTHVNLTQTLTQSCTNL